MYIREAVNTTEIGLLLVQVPILVFCVISKHKHNYITCFKICSLTISNNKKSTLKTYFAYHNLRSLHLVKLFFIFFPYIVLLYFQLVFMQKKVRNKRVLSWKQKSWTIPSISTDSRLMFSHSDNIRVHEWFQKGLLQCTLLQIL